MSAIDKAYADLLREGFNIGSPVGPETPCRDLVGRYRDYEKAAIYWSPRTGAHALWGGALARWRSAGAEISVFGYPRSTDPLRFERSRGVFEGGIIEMRRSNASLTALSHNIALISPYKGHHEEAAKQSLISHLRDLSPDFVGLQECWSKSDAQRFTREVGPSLRYAGSGPELDGDVRDGGLLLLTSGVPGKTHSLVFHVAAGLDSIVSKGVLHARVKPAGLGFEFDVYTCHLQNDDTASIPGELAREGFGIGDATDESVGVSLEQARQVASFIQSTRDRKNPAILMGDFNITAQNAIWYQKLRDYLGDAIDVAGAVGDGGFTLDSANNFDSTDLKTGRTFNESGCRVDYIFGLPGSVFAPVWQSSQTIRWTDVWNKDVSDHYGLFARMSGIDEAIITISRDLGGSLWSTLDSLHCLQVTGTLTDAVKAISTDADEIDCKLTTVANHASAEAKSGELQDFNAGTLLPPRHRLDTLVPSAGLHSFYQAVTLEEVDDVWGWFETDRSAFGLASDTITRQELASCDPQVGLPVVVRVAGEGAVYAAKVTSRLVPWSMPAAIPGWIGGKTAGAGIAIADIDGDGRLDVVSAWLDSPEGEHIGYYRIGWGIHADGTVDAWSEPVRMTDPSSGDLWFGASTQGFGVALADVDGDGRPELVVMHVDHPGGQANPVYHRAIWIDPHGAIARVGPTHRMPDAFGWESQGAGIAVADIDGDGQLDLVLGVIDNPEGSNNIRYRVGLRVGPDGAVSEWLPVQIGPAGLEGESAGGGFALADLDGDGRPELIALVVDNPASENHINYYVGRALDGSGSVTGGWSGPLAVPGWSGAENQGADVALADVDGDGRPEIVVLSIDNPEGENHAHIRVGRGVTTSGEACIPWAPAPAMLPFADWVCVSAPIAQSAPAASAASLRALDVMARSSEGRLLHLSRGLGEFSQIDADLAIVSAPSVASSWTGRTEVVACARGGGLVHVTWEGSWSAPRKIEAKVASIPSVVSAYPGTLDCFFYDEAGHLWQASWNGTVWGAPTDLGLPADDEVSVGDLLTPVGAGMVRVRRTTPGLVVGTERIVGPSQDRPVTDDVRAAGVRLPVPRGSSVVTRPPRESQIVLDRPITALGPAVVSRASRAIDLVASDPDGALYHRAFVDGAWGPWKRLGGSPRSAPTLVSRDADTLDLFVRGQGGSLQRRTYRAGGWHAWNDLGGGLIGEPAAAVVDPGRIAVVVRGVANDIWTGYCDAEKWSGFQPLGGYVTAQPIAVSPQPGNVEVFVRGGDGRIWHRSTLAR